MLVNRKKLTTFLCLNPASVITAALLNGIISYFLYSADLFVSGGSLLLSSSLVLFLLMKFSDQKTGVPVLIKFILFSLLGWMLAFNSDRLSDNEYAALLPHENCAAEIEVRFADRTDPGKSVTWMPRPNSIVADVLNMRTSQYEKWHACRGRVMLKFPNKRELEKGERSQLKPLDYGDVAQINGAFVEPEDAAFDGAFSYKDHLRTEGIRKIFYVTSMKRVKSEVPLHIACMQRILHFRNRIMSLMAEGMSNPNRKMLAALMFGCRQGLDYASRRTFLQSGVIHIFAISGLHVGMIAFSLFLILRWVPFRLRYILVPLFLAVYVVTTGMHASAMRALLMISIWSFMKAFLYRTSPLNIVFIAASVMLLLNPFSLFSAGFQFSFIIAGFLVFAWHSVNEWIMLLNEKNLWIPSDMLRYRDVIYIRFKNASFNSFITSSVAWLSGASILLMHRSFFIPGAVFTNFIIIPVVWLLFVTAMFDVLLLPLHSLFTLNPLMELLLNFIRIISTAGADLGGGINLPAPPLFMVIIFMIVLIFFITARRRAVSFISASIILALISFLLISGKIDNAVVAIFHGGESQEPAIVAIPPDGGFGVIVINPGPEKRVRVVVDFLKRKGVNSVDYLIFTANRKSCCESAWLLLSSIEVKHTVFPPGVRRSRYATLAMKNALQSGGAVTTAEKIQNFFTGYSCSYPGLELSGGNNSNYALTILTPSWRMNLMRKGRELGEKIIEVQTLTSPESLNVINSNSLSLSFLIN